ncbi:MAG: efflux RND transporter permease subunit [Acidobacteriota bacterium]
MTGWTTLYLRNRHLLALTVLLVMVAGFLSLQGLPRLEDPRIINRNPVVLTVVPGASAERVEARVTEVLEDALSEIDAIDRIESTSRDGLSVLAVKLRASVDGPRAREAVSEIRDRLGGALGDLPPEALEPVVDDQRDPAAYTLIVALQAAREGDQSLGLLGRLAEDLADRLRAVDGTELVRLFGAADEELTVVVDPERLAALDLSAADVARALAGADAKRPAGVLRGSSDVGLELRGALDGLERVAAVPLLSGDGAAWVRVGDVARVERGVRRPLSEQARIDGRPAVLVAARMESGRIDRWAADADAVLEAFRAEVGALESGGGAVRVVPIFEQEEYTSERLRELVGNLVAGAAVVLAVVLAVMGWRLALVVGAALPLTVAAVLVGLQLGDKALHQMSIFGVIIALGLLIDNAIVVADEVARRRQRGHSAPRAVDGALRKLAGPLLASTTTTVLAFTPILLLPGDAGDFVGTIGLSVVLALVASYGLAITVVAGLAGRLAPAAPETTPGGGRSLLGLGRRGLLFALRRPVVGLVVACFLPAAGFLAARSLGQEFFPAIDRDQFEVRLWLPEGTATATTRALVERAEAITTSFAAVDRVDWMIGGNFPSVFYNLAQNQDGASHFAHAIVHVRSADDTSDLLVPLQQALDQALPESQAVVRQFAQGPPVGADVEIRVLGPAPSTLRALGERVRLEMQRHQDVLHARTGLGAGSPKLWHRAVEDEARLVGLSLDQVAAQLSAQLEGAVGGTVLEDLEQMPVRVRVAGAERSDLTAVATLPVVARGGGRLPLEALGSLELEPQVGSITRHDGERVNTISGFVRQGALPLDVTADIVRRLEASGLALPPGYRLELGGAHEEDAEAKGNLALYAPFLVTLTVALLILTFRSVGVAALLLLVAALSIGPGLLATRLLGLPISFNTILGTLGLVGLAFNNSIVVLAALRENPAARRGELAAVVDEVLGATRHILATTLTTIGGFLPLLLFVGGDFWPSLAIVMVGGVGGSAILALVLVPIVHHRLLASRARRHAPALATAVSALVLSGCVTVGPDYRAPEVEIGQAFAASADDSPAVVSPTGAVSTPAESVEGPSADTAWWRVLEDPLLDEWAARVAAQNLDLAAAHARVREARAARRAAGADGRPRVGLGLDGRRFEVSENGAGAVAPLAELGLAPRTGEVYEAGFDAGWELDLFGRIRRGVEAASARAEAAVEARRGVLVALLAETAREVLELRGAARELDAIDRAVAAQRRTLEQVQVKVEVGLAAPLELEQARAQLAATRARLAAPRARRLAAAHRLAVLAGVPPAGEIERLGSLEPLSPPDELVPAGLPAELLLRRPDVRAAERSLQAASADIGVAVGRRFPRLVFGGAGGLESLGFGDIFAAASGQWTLGVGLEWPLFEGGRLRAGVEAAEARFDVAEASYRAVVLAALEEVETALVGYGEAQVARRELEQAAVAAGRAAMLARGLHEDGLVDFLVRLDAERRAAEADEALARAETAVGVRLVGVYKALGGGWRVFEAEHRVAETDNPAPEPERAST